jgi:hypothetical protein
MSRARGGLLIAGLALCFGAVPSRSAEPDLKAPRGETISGRSFRAMQAALPELQRYGLKADDYTIIVTQLGADLVVLFVNPEHASFPHATGCVGSRPCFGVALDPTTFKVIRSSFQK